MFQGLRYSTKRDPKRNGRLLGWWGHDIQEEVRNLWWLQQKIKGNKNIQEVLRRLSLCSQSEGSWVLLVKKSERARCGSSPSGGSQMENKNKAPGPTDGPPRFHSRSIPTTDARQCWTSATERATVLHSAFYIHRPALTQPDLQARLPHTHTHTPLSERITLSRSLYSAPLFVRFVHNQNLLLNNKCKKITKK